MFGVIQDRLTGNQGSRRRHSGCCLVCTVLIVTLLYHIVTYCTFDSRRKVSYSRMRSGSSSHLRGVPNWAAPRQALLLKHDNVRKFEDGPTT